jgi:protein translocase SecG subunit
MNFLSLLGQIKPYLPAAQIAVALILIILVLLQPRGESLGSAFGQSFAVPGKLRGISKHIFWFTLSIGIIFVVLALLRLLL